MEQQSEAAAPGAVPPSGARVEGPGPCLRPGRRHGEDPSQPVRPPVQGVDVSDEAVQEAVRRTQVHNRHGARLDFLVGDMRTLDWCALCDVADAGSPYKEWTGVADGWRLGEPYDAPGHRYGLINMQYALHYACATRRAPWPS